MPISSSRLRGVTAGLAGLTLAGLAAPALAATEGTNQLVAVHDVDGTQSAQRPSINGSAQVASHDGRYVVFSTPSALVPEDVNELDDVYLRDTTQGHTTLVSVRKDGTQGNDYSVEPTISADGTKVAFTTWASNLVRDRNGHELDVVVKDLSTGVITLASVRNDGTQADRNSFFPVISANGRHVAFQTFGRLGRKDRDRLEDVYVRNLATGRTRQVSLRRDGRDVAASVLVGDVSDNGRLVTFGNDNNAWLRDTAAKQTRRVWHEDNDPAQPFPMGSVGRPVISGNGAFVAFSTMSTSIRKGETDHFSDVFRLDLSNGTFSKVTVPHADGPADGHSFIPSLSRDGRYIGFSSEAENLVPGSAAGSDVFVRDMVTGTTYLASTDVDGDAANGESGRTAVAVSGDGAALVYESYASDLVSSDTNAKNDVVLWKR